jgi:hypothetical protein
MWLLNEDAAIKAKLSGLKVTDSSNPDRPVGVRYRLPDDTYAKMTFPMIIIEHGNIAKADDREHRGSGLLPYAPEGKRRWADYENPDKSPYWHATWPIPYNLDYQITTYSRHAMHDRVLTAMLAGSNRLPARGGFLEIPQDGTVRRMDLIGGPEPDEDRDADGKRLFKTVYTVRVSSELFPEEVEEVVRVIDGGVHLDVIYYDTSISVPALVP